MLTGRRCEGTPVMSWPSIRMRPLSGVSRPASRRSNVVLPQPEPPSSANSSPRAISRSTPSTAMTVPKRLASPSILTIASFTGPVSLTSLDRGPQPRALARLLGRAGGDGVEVRPRVVRRIDRLVAGERLGEQRCRGTIAIGVVGERARGGGDLGVHHEVEEVVGIVGLGGVVPA